MVDTSTIKRQNDHTMKQALKRIPGCLFLLRKSSETENEVPVMKTEDFPARFLFNDKEYSLQVTRNGGLVLR